MSTIDFDLSCANCSNSLYGVDLLEVCPFCQTPVGDTVDISVLDNTSLTVISDLVCRTCEYNLRSLYAGSKCPECGIPVTQSLSTNPLRYSDHRWLRYMSSGATGMYIAGIAAIVIVFLSFVSILGVGAEILGCFIICVPFVYLIGAAGATRVTMEEPEAGERCKTGKLGLCTQVTVYGPILFVFAVLIAGNMIHLWPFTLSGIPAGFCLAFVNLRRIANRIHESRLAKRTTISIRFLAVGTTGIAVYGISIFLQHAFKLKLPSGLSTAFNWIILPAGLLCILVGFISGVIALRRFSKLLHDAVHNSPEYLETTDDLQNTNVLHK